MEAIGVKISDLEPCWNPSESLPGHILLKKIINKTMNWVKSDFTVTQGQSPIYYNFFGNTGPLC